MKVCFIAESSSSKKLNYPIDPNKCLFSNKGCFIGWDFFLYNYILCRVELVKLLPVHQFSVDIFSYSGPPGILSSGGKQNTT